MSSTGTPKVPSCPQKVPQKRCFPSPAGCGACVWLHLGPGLGKLLSTPWSRLDWKRCGNLQSSVLGGNRCERVCVHGRQKPHLVPTAAGYGTLQLRPTWCREQGPVGTQADPSPEEGGPAAASTSQTMSHVVPTAPQMNPDHQSARMATPVSPSPPVPFPPLGLEDTGKQGRRKQVQLQQGGAPCWLPLPTAAPEGGVVP